MRAVNIRRWYGPKSSFSMAPPHPIGSIGDAYNNALMKTIIGIYKAESVRRTIFHRGPYKTIADVENATAG